MQLARWSGSGRLIIIASAANEPAWENAKIGHGYFTNFVIEAMLGALEVKLQIDAIYEYGVLNGEHLVVVAPTSSGKTMIGKLAALHSTMKRQRALFLLPLKALVSDKHQYFKRNMKFRLTSRFLFIT